MRRKFPPTDGKFHWHWKSRNERNFIGWKEKKANKNINVYKHNRRRKLNLKRRMMMRNFRCCVFIGKMRKSHAMTLRDMFSHHLSMKKSFWIFFFSSPINKHLIWVWNSIKVNVERKWDEEKVCWKFMMREEKLKLNAEG